jgi:hypothetical protein
VQAWRFAPGGRGASGPPWRAMHRRGHHDR